MHLLRDVDQDAHFAVLIHSMWFTRPMANPEKVRSIPTCTPLGSSAMSTRRCVTSNAPRVQHDTMAPATSARNTVDEQAGLGLQVFYSR